ncbi:uncharacterized protein SETTUDRAFT_164246 [Exserohilum turcica Et28A]|uniref:Uncharacterized protein n=1 Tax=Exserohilum turcicum (strain 28A) TaxID=671987 RepID=R0JRU8_EXST2|nr:uncharacterized protein SETTUDRAFT_164246 [Exserohilum turcica Et28A]EOA83843.1 hypothetical protein SETTUDRAFT_164246 [Exserohilum turcica Et28A]
MVQHMSVPIGTISAPVPAFWISPSRPSAKTSDCRQSDDLPRASPCRQKRRYDSQAGSQTMRLTARMCSSRRFFELVAIKWPKKDP